MNSKDILIKTGVSRAFLTRTLTQDIDCTECLFDLIDNSIDAARQIITSQDDYSKDDTGLPASYSGFLVKIEINHNKIVISDNCSGVTPEVMRNRLLVIGEESNQPHGIGHFGVGLKRALLKLGKNYEITTSNNGDMYSLICSDTDLQKDDGLIATHIGSSDNESHTKIIVTDLTDEANREIVRAEDWERSMARQIAIRYNNFLKKGIEIELNENHIKPACPEVKAHHPVTIQLDTLPATHGITAHIKAGMHQDYFKVGEAGYDLKKIESITEDYGWYYVCNDRVIKIATKEKEFGWAKRWHNEYYGFVGWVHFVGPVSDLPWNTKKTAIDPGSPVFAAIKDKLKAYADNYRNQNRKLKKAKTVPAEAPGVPVKDEDQLALITEDLIARPVSGKPAPYTTEPFDEEADSKSTDEPYQDDFGTGETEAPFNAGGKATNRKETKIARSPEITRRLELLGSRKLLDLYNSLCTVHLTSHSALIDVGAWAFFESLSRLIFQKSGTSFYAAFNSEINQEWYKVDPANKKPAIKNSIKYIHEEGNLVKHDAIYSKPDSLPLAVHFKVLEPLLIKALDTAIKRKEEGFVPAD